MNRILIVVLSILGIVVGTSLMSPAAPKNDGRPDGGTLGYGEYGRPSTLDPITSNEMISLRKDVMWHPKEGEDAKPFTADDVVFTYNIMMHPRTITPLKVRYEFIDKVERV